MLVVLAACGGPTGEGPSAAGTPPTVTAPPNARPPSASAVQAPSRADPPTAKVSAWLVPSALAKPEPSPKGASRAAWGGAIGDAFGAAPANARDGGGGRGEGICLCGDGEGSPRPPPGGWASLHGAVRRGALEVSGKLPPEIIARIAWEASGRLLACYEDGWRRKRELEGRVSLHFVVNAVGSVSAMDEPRATLPDSGVVACVKRVIGELSFPQPDGGVVAVDYALDFQPSGRLAPRR